MKHLTIILAFLVPLSSPVAAQDANNPAVLTGKVTHVRDGDTIEVNGIAIRLSALDCPERGTQKGDTAARIAQQFQGSPATCDVNVPRLPKLFFC